jgi:hypothetical protein
LNHHHDDGDDQQDVNDPTHLVAADQSKQHKIKSVTNRVQSITEDDRGGFRDSCRPQAGRNWMRRRREVEIIEEDVCVWVAAHLPSSTPMEAATAEHWQQHDGYKDGCKMPDNFLLLFCLTPVSGSGSFVDRALRILHLCLSE